MKKIIIPVLIVFCAAMSSCTAMKRQAVVKVPETVDEQKEAEKNAEDHYNKGRFEDSVGVLLALLKKDPENPVYWSQLGSAYAQLSAYNFSVEAYKKAIELDPADVKARYNLSVVHSEYGSSAEAMKTVRDALKISPRDPMLQASYGNVLIDQNRLEPAKQVYSQIARAKPDFDVAHFNLGVINYKERNLDEAEKNYENVLKINPRDYEAKQNLAAIKILNGDFETAVKYLKDVVASNPADDIVLSNAYFNMGIAYLRLNKHRDALKAFETVISIEPWDMAAYVNAAIISEHLGMKDKAANYWQRYNRLLPVNKRKEEIKRRMEGMGKKFNEGGKPDGAQEGKGKK
ncbi:MAG TPA: tetratricopeptide repeat protein [bacterium]|nr:tetratricopeptide repeat protein [bacterium]